MKRIFKPAAVFLTALLNFNVLADEGEIYQADINSKPQVLIILDTSTHMKKEADYPYPKYYDPHIAYPPIPDSKGEDLIYRWFYGGESFYYNRSQSAKGLNHADLVAIAEKGVDNLSGGSELTKTEKAKYKAFVETIPTLNGDKKIDYSSMNCYSALDDFQGDLGAYQDYIGQWLIDTWILFFPLYNWDNIGSQNTELVRHFVDCQEDIAGNISRNPGYEHNVLKKADDSNDDGYNENISRQGIPSGNVNIGHVYWDSYGKTPQASFTDKAYIYSDNLVKWNALSPDENGNFKLSNLQIAKKVILDIMLNTPEIKTGLEISNPNNAITKLDILDNNGGRIISGIRSYDPEDYDTDTAYKSKKSSLKNKVKNIFTTGYSKSALCESLYEGYRYLYGEGVWFGDDVLIGAKPKRDRNVEKDSTYISPMDWTNSCQTEAYIIMVTAGYHDVTERPLDLIECGSLWNGLIRVDDFDHDSKANTLIANLPGMTEKDIKEKAVQVNKPEKTCDKNLLPVLSGWLANNDINSDTDVKERIVTYTVGIGDLPAGNRTLLEKTAEYGDGEFYNALNANELRQKLEMAFADIIARQKGVTASVGTSINSSNSTKSNESVYYTMFQPNQTSRWTGNLRKLKVTDNGVLSAWTNSASDAPSTDSATSPALLESDAEFFNDNLYSGWSSEQGLNDVAIGGVVESLKNRTTERNIYITNADNSSLLKLDKSNLLLAFDVDNDADLANNLGVSEDTLDAAISWLQGKNEAGKNRDDIFGDPMHAEPLVVEYPDTESELKVKSRIFIGTNAGFFHAFKDNGRVVEEEWAFIPKENLATALKLNLQVTKAENRIYGIDGSAVDAEYEDSNGNIRHIITFGQRRGGSNYYSLNVNIDPENTNATKPELNWIISGDITETETKTKSIPKLGQTWSTPEVTKVIRGTEDISDKPVLIFGGGYDSKKDNCGANNSDVVCNDLKGRGVYIVDADSGKIIKKFEQGVISDSIASKVAVMDSNGDGYTDRIYAPDTGGNVYRVDMPNTFGSSTDLSSWQLFKLAQLGGSGEDDRRFFSPPSIVRARDIDSTPYDGLLLGSGDITSPNTNTTARNYFFNIKDTTLLPTLWGSEAKDGKTKIPDAIEIDNLNTITYNTPEELGENNEDNDPSKHYKVELVDNENSINGWKFELSEADSTKGSKDGGEKSFGAAVVIDGVVHFNTYTPFSKSITVTEDQCILNQSGSSHYYQVNLNTGGTEFYRKLPNVIAKDLSVHAASKDGASVLRLLGAGKGDLDKTKKYTGTVDTEVKLIPKPVYLYFDEQKLANTNTSPNTNTDSDEAAQ